MAKAKGKVGPKKKRRALVTGGAGFLGSHLCDRLLSEGYHVLCMDYLITSSYETVAHLGASEPDFEYVDHDVSASINLPGELDEIYHFASPASPADFERIPIEILKASAMDSHNCLELALARGARFMLASTSEVYGDPLVHPQHEDYRGNVSTTGPRSVHDEALGPLGVGGHGLSSRSSTSRFFAFSSSFGLLPGAFLGSKVPRSSSCLQ